MGRTAFGTTAAEGNLRAGRAAAATDAAAGHSAAALADVDRPHGSPAARRIREGSTGPTTAAESAAMR